MLSALDVEQAFLAAAPVDDVDAGLPEHAPVELVASFV
jgi:hypothetical protein